MSGKKWILLVAGSKGWEHYKHQANVCLHYQLIKRHGIPDDQIVVMMYDDIAHSKENKVSKGEIVSIIDGLDVYSGVPKDYTGEDVTPENFLSALRGDTNTNKKFIESGPNDNIYVYMTGLGTEDGFQFPDKALSPKDLIGTIKNMHTENKFSKMVIYMDSDYSGLMFEGLTDVNVFALTSCHKYIENTPADYDAQRKVYLSDLFSSTWLRHLNDVDFSKDTFTELVNTKQSKYLKDNPDEACPCRFGDKKITQCHLREFLQK
ncbi:hypothetical protein R3I93_005454 [Phoxinus phoxinus]|uniref:Legumain n=1 Tax=Phoxinus phoxinus TaxID=58324 RepID=A0AAN9HCU2_9TELE